MDETTCMVKALTRLTHFYYDESCGQCTPCREGTGWLYHMLTRILNGKGELSDIEKLDKVALSMCGTTICALADAAAFPVMSFLKHFREEFVYFIEHKQSMIQP